MGEGGVVVGWHQFIYWTIVTSVYVGVPLVLTTRWPGRRRVVQRLALLTSRWSARVRQANPDDPFADDLARVLRREHLHGDLIRLERLLKTDDFMSATRQMGNRLAYAQLRRQLAEEGDPFDAAYAGAYPPTYSSALSHQLAVTSGEHRGHRPTVETLEIRWRR